MYIRKNQFCIVSILILVLCLFSSIVFANKTGFTEMVHSFAFIPTSQVSIEQNPKPVPTNILIPTPITKQRSISGNIYIDNRELIPTDGLKVKITASNGYNSISVNTEINGADSFYPYEINDVPAGSGYKVYYTIANGRLNGYL